MQQPELHDWDGVDEALRRLGEIDIAVERINGEATVRINQVKDEAREKAKPLSEERKTLARAVRSFCEAHKDEFAKKRHKRLTFGEIGYRLVRQVPIPRAKDKVAALLKALRAFGCGECIQVEERPDRDKIAALDDATIAKLGLTRTVRDSFRIVPDVDAISEEAA